MGTSQDLVPTGLPYGSRGATVAQMQAADIPLSSENAQSDGIRGIPAPGSPAGPTPVAPAGPVSRGGLDQFDALTNRAPTADFVSASGGDPTAVLQARIASSPNSALRYYFGRFQEFSG